MTERTRLQLTRLDNFEQFVGLKAEWDALAATQVDTIFLTHDWLNQWWQFYGADYQLWTLVVRDEGKLVGVVPLMFRRGSGGFRRLMFMGTGEVTPNHLDIIVQPDRRADVLYELSVHLCQTVSQWDILELDKLPADVCTAEQLSLKLQVQGMIAHIETFARCPYAELPDSFETYLQARSSTTRQNYRRQKRHLERDFSDVRFACVETPEELDRVMTALVRMHQARWTQRGYTGAFSNERFIRFHRAVASCALRTGHLRLYFLQIGSEIAATYYCYRIADRVQYYLSGFDDRWSKYSLGILVNGYSIEQSIIEGACLFDFLEGEERYKERWATHTCDNLRLRVFSPHWRGQMARARTQIVDGLLGWSVRYVPLKVRRPIWQAIQRLRAACQQNTH